MQVTIENGWWRRWDIRQISSLWIHAQVIRPWQSWSGVGIPAAVRVGISAVTSGLQHICVDAALPQYLPHVVNLMSEVQVLLLWLLQNFTYSHIHTKVAPEKKLFNTNTSAFLPTTYTPTMLLTTLLTTVQCVHYFQHCNWGFGQIIQAKVKHFRTFTCATRHNFLGWSYVPPRHLPRLILMPNLSINMHSQILYTQISLAGIGQMYAITFTVYSLFGFYRT